MIKSQSGQLLSLCLLHISTVVVCSAVIGIHRSIPEGTKDEPHSIARVCIKTGLFPLHCNCSSLEECTISTTFNITVWLLSLRV